MEIKAETAENAELGRQQSWNCWNSAMLKIKISFLKCLTHGKETPKRNILPIDWKTLRNSLPNRISPAVCGKAPVVRSVSARLGCASAFAK